MSLAAILRVSRDISEVEPFMQSVNNEFFKEIIIVHSAQCRVEGAKVVAELHPETLTSDWIVEIPSYCTFSIATMDTIRHTIDSAQIYETHFAFSTQIDTVRPVGLAIGFTMIALMIEMIWNWLFRWNKLYAYHHIRVTAVMRKGPHAFIPPNPSGWFANWHVRRIVPAKNTKVADTLLLRETLNLKLGWWLFIYLPLYVPAVTSMYTIILTRNVFLLNGIYWAMLFVCGYLAPIRVPWWTTLCTPFYFVAFPFFIATQ